MTEKCSVYGCASESASSGIKLYRCPRSGFLLEQWKTVLQLRDCSSGDRVCNLHFRDKDFILTNLGWKVLAPGAVPSLNLPPFKLCDQPNDEDSQSPEPLSVELLPSTSSSSNERQHFKCSRCEEKYADRCSLLIHLAFHTPGLIGAFNLRRRKPSDTVQKRLKLPCQECGKIFLDKIDYWKHMKTICHRQKCGSDCVTAHNFFCCLCGLLFECRKQLRNHAKAFHPSGVNTTVCTICGLDLGSLKNLRYHAKIHMNLRTISLCDVCDRVFFSVTEQVIHSESHGIENECPECRVQLDDVQGLALHLKIHTSEPFFSCNYCPLVFGTLASVKAHSQVHDLRSDVPVECHICEHATAIFMSTYFHKHGFYKDPVPATTYVRTYARKKCKTEDTDRFQGGSKSAPVLVNGIKTFPHGKTTYSEESTIQDEIYPEVNDPIHPEMADIPQFLGVKGNTFASFKPITIKVEVAGDAIW